MEEVRDAPGRIKIDFGMRALSGKDLIEESSKMPVREFDTGHGILVRRQGMMIKVVGSENLSPHAMIAAIRSSQMGGDAGRAMFDTYQKNNPDQFDGSQTFDAIMKKASAPPPRPPIIKPTAPANDAAESGVTKNGGNGAKLTGTPGGDFLTGLRNSTLYGGDGDDVLTGGHGSTLYGGDGNDVLSGGSGSTLYGGTGDDVLSGGSGSTLYGGAGSDVLSGGSGSTLHGGAGNDVLNAAGKSTLNGGAGDDSLSAYGNGNLSGGSGDDRLSAYHDSSFNGGKGDDSIEGYNNSQVVDMHGDNYVSAYRDSAVTTGDGNDWIAAYSGASIRAGNGNNMISTYNDSSVVSGDNADMIEVGVNSLVISGGGNDLIHAGSDSIVIAGAGDDRVTLKGASTYHFALGDGNDIIGGGSWGQAYRQTENLSSSVIAFGDGITADDLSFEGQGNDLLIRVGQNDSLRIRDYQRHGIPSLTFHDGTSMGSEDITNVVGPGDAYRPTSQLMQNWHDANIAYQKGNTVKDTGT